MEQKKNSHHCWDKLAGLIILLFWVGQNLLQRRFIIWNNVLKKGGRKGNGRLHFRGTPPACDFEPSPSGDTIQRGIQSPLFEAADKRPRSGTRLSSCPYHLSDDAAKIRIIPWTAKQMEFFLTITLKDIKHPWGVLSFRTPLGVYLHSKTRHNSLTSKNSSEYGKFRTVASFGSSFHGSMGSSGIRGRRSGLQVLEMDENREDRRNSLC